MSRRSDLAILAEMLAWALLIGGAAVALLWWA